MPRVRNRRASRVSAKETVADKSVDKVLKSSKTQPVMDAFEFREFLKKKIMEDSKSVRAFAIDNEEALGFEHSVVCMSMSSKKKPSSKVLGAIAKHFGVGFKKERYTVENYKIEA